MSSQNLIVEAVPENAIGASAERVRAPVPGAVAKAGTPGSVPHTYFDKKTSSSVRAKWGTPSDGGRPLTGFGLLFWRAADQQPAYSSALVKGASARSHTYSDLEANTTYKWRIHACNGTDSCGYWTVPIVQVTTLSESEPPPVTPTEAPTSTPAVAELRKRSAGKNTVTVEWDAPRSDSATLSGYHVQHRVDGTSWPTGSDVVTPGSTTSWTIRGLINGTRYNVRIQACYGTAGCSAWRELRDADDPATAGNKVGNARIQVSKHQIEVGERLQVTIYDIPVGKVAYMNMYGSIQPEGRCPSRTRAVRAVPRRIGQPSTGGWYDSGRIEGCADGGLGHIRVTNRD